MYIYYNRRVTSVWTGNGKRGWTSGWTYFDHFSDTDVDLQSKINQFPCRQYWDFSTIIWTTIPGLFAMHSLLAHKMPVGSPLILLSFTLWSFKKARSKVIYNQRSNGRTRENIVQSLTCTCMICMIVKVSRLVEIDIRWYKNNMTNMSNTTNIKNIINIVNIIDIPNIISQ